ncbi:MAG: disulfide bond formation protein B [Minisyncoccota bacterium]
MVNTIQSLLPWGVLLSNIGLVIVFFSLLFNKDWGKTTSRFIGKYAVSLGLLVASAAFFGSLFYSNIVGFPPCELCWWQRIFIYPLLPLFAVAFWKRDGGVFRFAVPLSVIASVVSIYHLFVQMGGNSIIPCSASATCDSIYVNAFGYVTIPAMALTVSITILLLSWAKRIYDKNSNA